MGASPGQYSHSAGSSTSSDVWMERPITDCRYNTRWLHILVIVREGGRQHGVVIDVLMASFGTCWRSVSKCEWLKFLRCFTGWPDLKSECQRNRQRAAQHGRRFDGQPLRRDIPGNTQLSCALVVSTFQNICLRVDGLQL